jgi:hypothetical protein
MEWLYYHTYSFHLGNQQMVGKAPYNQITTSQAEYLYGDIRLFGTQRAMNTCISLHPKCDEDYMGPMQCTMQTTCKQHVCHMHGWQSDKSMVEKQSL